MSIKRLSKINESISEINKYEPFQISVESYQTMKSVIEKNYSEMINIYFNSSKISELSQVSFEEIEDESYAYFEEREEEYKIIQDIIEEEVIVKNGAFSEYIIREDETIEADLRIENSYEIKESVLNCLLLDLIEDKINSKVI